MGSGASIYSEQLYLDIDTSRLSSDESIEGMDNDTIDTYLTNDSMDSDLFLSEDVLLTGCFAHSERALGITQVEHHQRQVDGHANQACHDQGEVIDKIAME